MINRVVTIYDYTFEAITICYYIKAVINIINPFAYQKAFKRTAIIKSTPPDRSYRIWYSDAYEFCATSKGVPPD